MEKFLKGSLYFYNLIVNSLIFCVSLTALAVFNSLSDTFNFTAWMKVLYLFLGFSNFILSGIMIIAILVVIFKGTR